MSEQDDDIRERLLERIEAHGPGVTGTMSVDEFRGELDYILRGEAAIPETLPTTEDRLVRFYDDYGYCSRSEVDRQTREAYYKGRAYGKRAERDRREKMIEAYIERAAYWKACAKTAERELRMLRGKKDGPQ